MIIHEFSTGVELERTPNGGWVSLGFTGKYMNCTLDPIPHPIERSIANLEFALIIAAFSKEPAIIGRVVGTWEDSWAVMAVVTQARYEKGRSLSLYRYFFTPRANNLRYLLAWWESQGKPTFNPLDSKNIGECAYFDSASAPSPDYDPTANDIELVRTYPTLLQPQQYNLTTVHTLAIKKHNLDPTQPISWAFNVKSLKKPRSFQIIQPAFLRAYENLEREISNPPPSPTNKTPDQVLNQTLKTEISQPPQSPTNKTPDQILDQTLKTEISKPPPLPTDASADQILDEIDQILDQTLKTEISKPPPLPTDPSADDIAPKKTLDKASTKKAIKAALQSLINFSQVKPPSVETIIDTLENQQLTLEEWYSLFDAQGATTAITEKIYSPPLARLITLRAIVIPETLPEFLKWLNIQSGKQPSEAQKTSLQFQGAIRGYFPKVREKSAGIKLLIPYLLKQEISPESIQWLFIKGRVWAACYSQFLNDVRYDLRLISQQSKTDRKNFDSLMFPLEIWQDLIDGYNNELNLPAIARYLSLAQLFELLEDYKLCAYFYQVSQGDVPKKIFDQAFPEAASITKFLGLEIHAKTSLDHFVISFCYVTLIILLGSILLEFYANFPEITWLQGQDNNTQNQENTNSNKSDIETPTTQPPNTTPAAPQPSQEIINIALTDANFNNRTMRALNNLMKELKIRDTQQKSRVLQQALNLPPDWNFSDINSTDDDKRIVTKIQLLQAIYEYQEKNKGLIADAIIDNGGATYNRLKQDAQRTD